MTNSRQVTSTEIQLEQTREAIVEFIQIRKRVPSFKDFQRGDAFQVRSETIPGGTKYRILPAPEHLKQMYSLTSGRAAVRTALIDAGVDPVIAEQMAAFENGVPIKEDSKSDIPAVSAPVPAPKPKVQPAEERKVVPYYEPEHAVQPLKPKKRGGFIYVDSSTQATPGPKTETPDS